MFDFSYGDDSFFDINFIGERTVHTELTCEKSVLILKVRSVTVVKKSLYISILECCHLPLELYVCCR